jgi:LysR substrate binding domain
VVRNVCNRLGGFEPDVRHRSDDGLVLSALVASGRAVALLPALLTAAVPQIIARRLRDERLQRTIFTATRATTTDARRPRPSGRHCARARNNSRPSSETLEVVPEIQDSRLRWM